MELELKHLAAYLPYSLKIQGQTHGEIQEMTGLNSGVVMVNHDTKGWADFFDIKLILRPWSDLTKEIEHNGEKFTPLMELFMLIHDYHLVQCNYGNLDYSDNNVSYQIDDEWNHVISFEKEEIDLSYDKFEQRFALMKEWDVLDFYYIEMHEKLKEWHFDIYGLIESGLAIDINTLNKN